VNARVIVVPCGGRKLDTETPVPAAELYVGSYHRAARRAAEVLAGSAGLVLILSALHGLVTLDQMLAPYELRAGQAGTVTGETIRAQAEALGIAAAEVVVLGGRAYVELARQAWPLAVAPLEGTRGIGEQLGRLAAIYKDQRTPVEGLVEEGAERAAIRQAEQAEHDGRRRAQYVTADDLHIDGRGTARVRFDFPGVKAKASARLSAALRIVTAYDVVTVQTDSFTLEALGAPEQLARFTSALPRLLDLAENYAEISARTYGRWERHSRGAAHVDELAPAERRAHARRFRAEAFEVIVSTLLTTESEIEVPEPIETAPMWDQAASVAGAIAEYGWFDVAEQSDAEEVDELLAAAVVELPTPAESSAALVGRGVLIQRRNQNDGGQLRGIGRERGRNDDVRPGMRRHVERWQGRDRLATDPRARLRGRMGVRAAERLPAMGRVPRLHEGW
jgi:hypothetical protein